MMDGSVLLDLEGINQGFMDQTGGDPFSSSNLGKGGNKGFGNIDMGKGMEALSGLINAYLGYRELKLAKEDLNFRRDAWGRQFNAQKGLVNNQLEDRNNRRLREGLTTRSTADFMAQYGVK